MSNHRTTHALVRFHRIPNALFLLLTVVLLAACARAAPVAVPEVRSGLPVLRDSVLQLYDRFTADPLDEAKVIVIQAEFRRLRDLETGAGSANVALATEISTLLESFDDHVGLRRRSVWSTLTRDNSKRRIGDLFASVIVSEQRAK